MLTGLIAGGVGHVAMGSLLAYWSSILLWNANCYLAHSPRGFAGGALWITDLMNVDGRYVKSHSKVKVKF